LISTFEWTGDAAQRILRVPAGFMRNKTQERIEELARERGATAIDLALVEDGIEIGKRMMAEMISTYSGPGAAPGATAAGARPGGAMAASPASAAGADGGTSTPTAPEVTGGGYLNEVRARAGH
jgi:proto-chlorophyllide reductase subunit